MSPDQRATRLGKIQPVQTLRPGLHTPTLVAPGPIWDSFTSKTRPRIHGMATPRRRDFHDRTGSVNMKVRPTPSSLVTQIFPPWSSMNFRERARPRPVPSPPHPHFDRSLG